MTLEDLVPPLELCKQIPEGEFEDSAMVWVKVLEYINGSQKVVDRVMDRRIVFPCRRIPAPTLAEILKELPAYDKDEHLLWCIAAFPEDGEIRVCGEAWRVGYSLSDSQLDRNPATAALRLWLSVMSDKSVQSEKSVTPEVKP